MTGAFSLGLIEKKVLKLSSLGKNLIKVKARKNTAAGNNKNPKSWKQPEKSQATHWFFLKVVWLVKHTECPILCKPQWGNLEWRQHTWFCTLWQSNRIKNSYQNQRGLCFYGYKQTVAFVVGPVVLQLVLQLRSRRTSMTPHCPSKQVWRVAECTDALPPANGLRKYASQHSWSWPRFYRFRWLCQC